MSSFLQNLSFFNIELAGDPTLQVRPCFIFVSGVKEPALLSCDLRRLYFPFIVSFIHFMNGYIPRQWNNWSFCGCSLTLEIQMIRIATTPPGLMWSILRRCIQFVPLFFSLYQLCFCGSVRHSVISTNRSMNPEWLRASATARPVDMKTTDWNAYTVISDLVVKTFNKIPFPFHIFSPPPPPPLSFLPFFSFYTDLILIW
jgi:hypothetical protein